MMQVRATKSRIASQPGALMGPAVWPAYGAPSWRAVPTLCPSPSRGRPGAPRAAA